MTLLGFKSYSSSPSIAMVLVGKRVKLVISEMSVPMPLDNGSSAELAGPSGSCSHSSNFCAEGSGRVAVFVWKLGRQHKVAAGKENPAIGSSHGLVTSGGVIQNKLHVFLCLSFVIYKMRL